MQLRKHDVPFVYWCCTFVMCALLGLALAPLSAQATALYNPDEATNGIHGVVRNEAGNPLADIQVTVYQQQSMLGWMEVRAARTNSSGEYATGALDTGLYRLRFIDTTYVYAYEFYNNQFTLSAAEDIPVAGDPVTGKDVVLTVGGQHCRQRDSVRRSSIVHEGLHRLPL